MTTPLDRPEAISRITLCLSGYELSATGEGVTPAHPYAKPHLSAGCTASTQSDLRNSTWTLAQSAVITRWFPTPGTPAAARRAAP